MTVNHVHFTLKYRLFGTVGLFNKLQTQKIVKQVHRWVYRLTSLGHQHWVCTSLGRSAPLPHTSYQD